MPKQNQRKTIGNLTDFRSGIPNFETKTTDERLDQLERGLTQVEMLLNDVIQQLDRPYRDQHSKSNGKPSQAKRKSKQAKPSSANQTGKPAKGPSPAERILAIMGTSEITRFDVYEKAELSKEQGNKAWDFLVRRKLVEKTGEKESPGRSFWKATGKKL